MKEEIIKIIRRRFDELEEFLLRESKSYKEKYFFDHLGICEDEIIEDINKLTKEQEQEK